MQIYICTPRRARGVTGELVRHDSASGRLQSDIDREAAEAHSFKGAHASCRLFPQTNFLGKLEYGLSHRFVLSCNGGNALGAPKQIQHHPSLTASLARGCFLEGRRVKDTCWLLAEYYEIDS